MKFIVNPQIEKHYAYCFFPFPFNNTGECTNVCSFNCNAVCSCQCTNVDGTCTHLGDNNNGRETQNQGGGLFGPDGLFGNR